MVRTSGRQSENRARGLNRKDKEEEFETAPRKIERVRQGSSPRDDESHVAHKGRAQRFHGGRNRLGHSDLCFHRHGGLDSLFTCEGHLLAREG